ncbi:MAG: ZIP family metal transporter [Bacteroidia bacterium]|nr:ZIP family metal transporter [Bacteroidia bacterium]
MSLELKLTVVALISGSVGSVAIASLLLLFRGVIMERIYTWLAYMAGGTLLGAAFFGMIPKALSLMDTNQTMQLILAGIFFFFILEKLILWHTCRNKNCERHIHTAVPMILIGDAFHNAIDGIVIAASFLSSIEMGLVVTLSVIFHEIPQEMGDFSILLKSGLSKKKALWYNMLSGSSAILAGILAYFFMQWMECFIPYALTFSAASFLYIALADLIPEMHKKTKISESVVQIMLIFIGISIIYLIRLIH